MSQANSLLFQDSPPATTDDKKYSHRKVAFKEYDTGQTELFPEDLENLIDKFHIARFIM